MSLKKDRYVIESRVPQFSCRNWISHASKASGKSNKGQVVSSVDQEVLPERMTDIDRSCVDTILKVRPTVIPVDLSYLQRGATSESA